MGTVSFPGVNCCRGVLLTTHLLLVPRSWKIRISWFVEVDFPDDDDGHHRSMVECSLILEKNFRTRFVSIFLENFCINYLINVHGRET